MPPCFLNTLSKSDAKFFMLAHRGSMGESVLLGSLDVSASDTCLSLARWFFKPHIQWDFEIIVGKNWSFEKLERRLVWGECSGQGREMVQGEERQVSGLDLLQLSRSLRVWILIKAIFQLVLSRQRI